MEQKLKQMLFRIIYDDLKLGDIENDLSNKGITKKEIPDEYKDDIVNYFTLLNDIHLENLTKSEKEELINYYSKIDEDDSFDKLVEFLNKNKLRLLLSEDKDGYCFYGMQDLKHAAPKRAIALAFNYIKYPEDSSVENVMLKEKYIVDMVNKLQFSNNGENGTYVVAVIRSDENNLAKNDRFTL